MNSSGRGLRKAFRTAAVLLRAPWLAPTLFAQLTASAGQVVAVDAFGSNPGRLRMLVYAPKTPPLPGAPIVVVLHGCGQTAATFAQESGWIAAADRFGFPLVLPEQTSSNNRGRCFHWFRPADTSRGRGEALSIRQMVGEAVARFAADPTSVFVVGLSAGGAMAAALLAAYPDVFTAGAVVGGLPVGCASNVAQGLSLMANAGHFQAAETLAAKARALGPNAIQASMAAARGLGWSGGPHRRPKKRGRSRPPMGRTAGLWRKAISTRAGHHNGRASDLGTPERASARVVVRVRARTRLSRDRSSTDLALGPAVRCVGDRTDRAVLRPGRAARQSAAGQAEACRCRAAGCSISRWVG